MYVFFLFLKKKKNKLQGLNYDQDLLRQELECGQTFATTERYYSF